jgi:BirA family biotin operon repressor/biotin-[acetyl-CoA-carboxylase] ligase
VKGLSVKRPPLNHDQISAGLQGGYWRVKVFDEVTSTQSLLREANPKHGDVFTAEYQSQGRGRLDRTFIAPHGSGLLFSLFIKPRFSKDQWGPVPLLMGMAVVDSINLLTSTTSFAAKWPNDVIAESGKVAGIISEVFGEGIIVGIGTNVTMMAAELPVVTASSIYLETGIEIDRNTLLVTILQAISVNLANWESGADVIGAYQQRSRTVGQFVEVTLPANQVIRAQAIGFSAEGGLILSTGETVTVGDVVHLREHLK